MLKRKKRNLVFQLRISVSLEWLNDFFFPVRAFSILLCSNSFRKAPYAVAFMQKCKNLMCQLLQGNCNRSALAAQLLQEIISCLIWQISFKREKWIKIFKRPCIIWGSQFSLAQLNRNHNVRFPRLFFIVENFSHLSFECLGRRVIFRFILPKGAGKID